MKILITNSNTIDNYDNNDDYNDDNANDNDDNTNYKYKGNNKQNVWNRRADLPILGGQGRSSFLSMRE